MIYQCFEIYKIIFNIIPLYSAQSLVGLKYLDQLFLFYILQLLLKIDVGNKLLIIGNNYLINGHKEKYFHHNKHLEKHTNTQSVIIS